MSKSLILTVADIETTGLKQEEGHRIIEIAMAVLKLEFSESHEFVEAKKVGSTWCQRINPGRSIDPGAQAVHGISIADLKSEPAWPDVAGKVQKILTMSDVLAAHNAQFDAPFIALELVRIGMDIPKFDVFCTMEHGRTATAMGKVPSLAELCWSLGVRYEEGAAHAADYDVNCTVECVIKGLRAGAYDLTDSLKSKYGVQVA